MSQKNETGYYFDTALIPPQFIICGVKLYPFSLGHFLILRHLGSPVNSENMKNIKITEGMYWLFHSLIVCGLTYEENIELLNDDKKFKDTCEAFSKNLEKTMAAEPNWNIYDKLNLFKKYLSYHFNIPMYEQENDSKEAVTGIDWTQGIYTVLKQNLGYTESEILNMPMRKLFYEWCSVAESNGCIKVWNKSSLQQYAAAKHLIKKR